LVGNVYYSGDKNPKGDDPPITPPPPPPPPPHPQSSG